jgi:hypothetical protein
MSKAGRAKTARIAGLKIDDPDVVAVLRVTEHLDSLSRERVLSCAARLYQYELLGINPSLTHVRAESQPAQCRNVAPRLSRRFSDDKSTVRKQPAHAQKAARRPFPASPRQGE